MLEPGAKIMLHDDRLGLEDGDRNGSIGDRRALWPVCNDEATRKARVTYHSVAEELQIIFVNLQTPLNTRMQMQQIQIQDSILVHCVLIYTYLPVPISSQY